MSEHCSVTVLNTVDEEWSTVYSPCVQFSPPCLQSACRRQHQTRAFTDHAKSEGKRSLTNYLYVNKNPDMCKDYPCWCVESYRNRFI